MKSDKNILRAGLYVVVILIAGCATSYQDYAAIGDTEESVTLQLGKPAERVVQGDFTGLQYDSSGFQGGRYQRQSYTIIFYGDKLLRQGYGVLKQQEDFPPFLIEKN